MNRYAHAMKIQLRGEHDLKELANHLISAVYGAEAQWAGIPPSNDPAVRLIAHRIAEVCRVRPIFEDQRVFNALMNECEEHSDVNLINADI